MLMLQCSFIDAQTNLLTLVARVVLPALRTFFAYRLGYALSETVGCRWQNTMRQTSRLLVSIDNVQVKKKLIRLGEL